MEKKTSEKRNPRDGHPTAERPKGVGSDSEAEKPREALAAAAADTQESAAVELEFVSLRMAAEIVVVVEDQDLLVRAGLLAV